MNYDANLYENTWRMVIFLNLFDNILSSCDWNKWELYQTKAEIKTGFTCCYTVFKFTIYYYKF